MYGGGGGGNKARVNALVLLVISYNKHPLRYHESLSRNRVENWITCPRQGPSITHQTPPLFPWYVTRAAPISTFLIDNRRSALLTRYPFPPLPAITAHKLSTRLYANRCGTMLPSKILRHSHSSQSYLQPDSFKQSCIAKHTDDNDADNG